MIGFVINSATLSMGDDMDKSLRRFAWLVLLLVAGIAVPRAAVAGGVPDVQLHVMTPAEINALASGPAPSLSYLAPAPQLPEQSRKIISGALDNALYGKWRNDPTALAARMTAIQQSQTSASPALSAAGIVIKTQKTVNNLSFDFPDANTESEPSVSGFGKDRVVVGFNSSADFLAGGSFSGYAFSNDGGKSFTEVHLGLPLQGSIVPLGDPDVVADSTGDFFYSTIAENFVTGQSYVLVDKSTDGGQNFASDSTITTSIGNFLDKSLMAVDTNAASPFLGRFYVTGTLFPTVGKTSIFVCTPAVGCTTLVHEAAQGSIPAIAPNGDVYVAWEQFTSGASDIDAIYFSKSTDGGATWSAPSKITDVTPILNVDVSDFVCGRQALLGGVRVNDFPALAIDTGAKSKFKGTIYVVWNDQRSGDPQIMGVRSTDGGATWQGPDTINKGGVHTDQFFPWVSVLPNGKVGVIWYDRSRDANNWYIDLAYATSGNGGKSWSQSFITKRPFPVVVNVDPITATCYMGDYNQVSNNGKNFLLAWGDNSNGDPNVEFNKK
jgi:hypothetical protein